MNTKKMKALVTVVSIIMMVCMLGTVVFATEGGSPNDIKPTYEGVDGIKTLGGKLMGILSTIGMVIAVLILMILGIKYMMGSAEEKAEYKKTMIPYLIGAILIFGASTIATMVFNFASKI